MKILAIDTSCDDTSVAISEERKILANVFWSKIKVHNDWGGVVPSEAKRQHEEFLEPAIKEALNQAKLDIKDIDYFAVTYGPGLAIALEAGIKKAKELALQYNKPLVAVNHMIGHIYSSLAQDENKKSYANKNLEDFEYPLLALTISGGHTDLYIMNGHLNFKHLAHTLDDAIGESFDKVGRMLGMGFPAGHKLEQAAKLGNSNAFEFPIPMKNSGDLNWSFSGLKTAVLYEIKKILGEYRTKPGKHILKMDDNSKNLDEKIINDVAAAFQAAATQSLTIKLDKALNEYNPKMLIIGGGVIANQYIRTQIEKTAKQYNVPVYYPFPFWLCTDNAAMIALAAFYYINAYKVLTSEEIKTLDRVPNLEI